MSADLVSDRMKNKKHYNSFHPSLGFFLHIDDVLSWFDAEPTSFKRVSALLGWWAMRTQISVDQLTRLDVKTYEALLKTDLECWKCKKSTKNIPALKQHLQQEWDKLAARKESKHPAVTRKRKASVGSGDNADKEEGSSKRSKTEEPSEEII